MDQRNQSNADPSTAYSPIEPGQQFRILRLMPANQISDDIDCEIVTAELKDPPTFEALSYVWGDLRCRMYYCHMNGEKTRLSDEYTRQLLLGEQSPPYARQECTVKLGDLKIGITANLDSALRYLRYPDRERALWVDALCIAQHDLDERSKHVGCMKDVYAACTRDLLWLGPNDALIQDARRIISDEGSIFSAITELEESNRTRISRREMLRPIRALFLLPEFWRRVWIMQEVSFAPEVILVAGNATMPWSAVESFLDTDRYIEQYGIPDAFHGPISHGLGIHNELGQAIVYPHILAHQRRSISSHGDGYGTSLMDVLARFRRSRATDPRDNIYGLLGLCSRALDIQPDYHATVREVYVDCSRRLIEHDGNLDLLCQGPWELMGNDERRTELPSWCPDYAHAGESRILFAQRGIYAAGPPSLDRKPALSLSGALMLDGLAVDALAVIRDRDSPLHAHGLPYFPGPMVAFSWMPNCLVQEAIDEGNASLEKFLKNEDEPIGDVKTGSRFEDYWRTLMVDSKRKPWRRLHEADLKDLRPASQQWRARSIDENPGWVWTEGRGETVAWYDG